MPQAAFVLITTKYGTERNVCQDLLKLEEVEDASVLYGQYDILAKIIGEDMNSVDKFILSNIRTHPDIESTQSMVVVGTD